MDTDTARRQPARERQRERDNHTHPGPLEQSSSRPGFLTTNSLTKSMPHPSPLPCSITHPRCTHAAPHAVQRGWDGEGDGRQPLLPLKTRSHAELHIVRWPAAAPQGSAPAGPTGHTQRPSGPGRLRLATGLLRRPGGAPGSRREAHAGFGTLPFGQAAWQAGPDRSGPSSGRSMPCRAGPCRVRPLGRDEPGRAGPFGRDGPGRVGPFGSSRAGSGEPGRAGCLSG